MYYGIINRYGSRSTVYESHHTTGFYQVLREEMMPIIER
jgi:hypothetical protein